MSDDDWGDESVSSPFVSQSTGGGSWGGRGKAMGGQGRDDRGYGGGGNFRGGRGGGRGGHRGDSSDEESGYQKPARREGRGGYSGGRGFDDESGGGNFRGRRGGGRGGHRGRDGSDDESGGFRGERRGGGRGGNRGFGRGMMEDGRGGGRDGQSGDHDMNGEDSKPAPVTYVPPEEDIDEKTMFESVITSGINFSKYDDIPVRVTGENAVPPVTSFDQMGLRNILLDNVKLCNYKVPTPIQKNAIPNVLNMRDLMACAQTGSGKTAAFLIPIINNLIQNAPDLVTGACCAPSCVVVSPTRELALQIYQEARKFAYKSVLKINIVYGGVSVRHQASQLMNGCHILVGTPGRLNDFVNRGWISFASIRFFVLDEADRMLDMGFLADIEKMLDHSTMVPKGERTTLMFSATFPTVIQQLAGKYLHDYLFLTIGVVGGACKDVQQRFFEVGKFQKKEKLLEIMEERRGNNELTLVFVAVKRIADFIAVYLCENDFKTTSIHGDRFQCQREEALRDFKTGRMPTLIATGVASRGLDIKNVAHVINFDLPPNIDEYVHRIGRTGRVGNSGLATSFYDSNEDASLAGDLVTILQQAGQPIPEFLGAFGDVNGYSARNDSFASKDIRKGRSAPLEPQDEEELWDD